MISSEEFVPFAIDASGSLPSSDSESDTEIPKFVLPVFKKYLNESENSRRLQCQLGSQSMDKSEQNGFYVNVYPTTEPLQKKIMKVSLEECDKKNLVAKPGFENLEHVPTFLSRRQSKKLRMKEKEKTKGYHWYDMPAPELNEEQKNDLMVVQMRQALDPKHFYKRSVRNANPKYFEVGTYVESPVDFYSSRIPKKQRKKTLVGELMADMEFCSYQKKKMSEIIASQPRKFHPKKSKRKPKVAEKKKIHVGKKKKLVGKKKIPVGKRK